MKIVICTKNAAKIAAVANILQKLGIDGEIVPLECESGVAATPMSENEGITGAMNRIHDAKRQAPDADYYVGMEGIINKNDFGGFLCGWSVVENMKGDRGIGCSAQLRLPDAITDNLHEIMRLSDEIERLFPEKKDELPMMGTNGVLTNGLYTRVDEFEDSLLCAFGGLIANSK